MNKCLVCDKELDPEKNQNKFCSRNCFNIFQNKKIERKCTFCGDPVFVKQVRMSRKPFCSHACYAKWLTGKPNSTLTKFQKGNIPPFKGKRFPHVTGPLNNHWKGGVTKLQAKIRKLPEYKNWRTQIFQRDNYVCQLCGQRGGEKQVDHYPKQFAQILVEQNITTLEQALACPQLWDMNSGRTLCVPCHKTTETYLRKYNGS